MSKLPRVSGQQAVAALQQIGFRVRRQHGSHIIMRRDDPFAQTVVPAHRELDRGTCERFSVRSISAWRTLFVCFEGGPTIESSERPRDVSSMPIRLLAKSGSAEHRSAPMKPISNGRAMLGVPLRSINRIGMVSSFTLLLPWALISRA
ncbi:MAG: type II toxin-antitoxin system HicA family toxin [Verrucomicrobiota bacterium]